MNTTSSTVGRTFDPGLDEVCSLNGVVYGRAIRRNEWSVVFQTLGNPFSGNEVIAAEDQELLTSRIHRKIKRGLHLIPHWIVGHRDKRHPMTTREIDVLGVPLSDRHEHRKP